jgi:protein disulfide-isomerase A1
LTLVLATGLSSYPTLLLFPADDKNNPVQHEGPRSVEALTTFIEEHAASLNDDADGDYDDSI